MKKTKRKILIIFVIVVLLLSSLFMTACWQSYTGNYPELYTVAINSMLWIYGHSYGADFPMDPEIEVLEKDNYGRVLFRYTERNVGKIAFSSLVIMQQSKDNYVYFYEDINFLSKEIKPRSKDIPKFLEEEIEQFKIANDWNTEIRLEKCVKKEITQKKAEVPIEEEKLESIYSELFLQDVIGLCYLFTYDDYNRFILFAFVSSRQSLDEVATFVFLFQPDLTYSVYEPSDLLNYQEEFAQFKAEHGWNQPLYSGNSVFD